MARPTSLVHEGFRPYCTTLPGPAVSYGRGSVKISGSPTDLHFLVGIEVGRMDLSTRVNQRILKRGTPHQFKRH